MGRAAVFAMVLVAFLLATGTGLAGGGGMTLIANFPLTYDLYWDDPTAGFSFGQPTGAGGDPTSGYSGPNVLGNNLSGAYAPSMGASYVMTGAIDCSHASGTMLTFWRWLGVEGRPHDYASVEVSDGDGVWTEVWTNPTIAVQDTAWTFCSYNISAIADGKPQVFIRWGLGPTDGSVEYSGWNIDDVQVWATSTWTPPLKVLAWVPYVDPGLNYAHYARAIAALQYTFPDVVVSESVTEDPATLAMQLQGQHVFFVPTQALATHAQSVAAGTAFASVLQSFASNGGTVVVTGEVSTASQDAYGFMNATGLMSVGTPQPVTSGAALTVAASLHALAAGVAPDLTASDHTEAYDVGDEATTVIADELGHAVVAAHNVGYGAAVMMGFDYWAPNAAAVQLIGNAVQYPRSTRSLLIYDSGTYRHSAQEAAHRLGQSYLTADRAIFNTLLAMQPWDVVVVEFHSLPPDGGWGPLADYIAAGGQVAISAWTLDDPLGNGLGPAFHVEPVENLAAIPTITRWDLASPVFTNPLVVPDLVTWADLYGTDAIRLARTDASQGSDLAGFTADPAYGQAALVLANNGRTLFNGFLWDDHDQDANVNSTPDAVEWAEDQMSFLLRRPAADFIGINTAGVAPLTVPFLDLSEGVVTAWLWNFGDGTESGEQHPAHTFSEVGTYPVYLKAQNSVNSDDVVKLHYVLVTFPDVPVEPEYWALHEILACVDAGIVQGYWDGYRPEQVVTRDQMAVYIARALAGGDANVPDGPPTATFGDVPNTGYGDSGTDPYWAYKYIEYCVAHGVVKGFDATHYGPTGVVTRDQMAVFVARARGWVGIDDPLNTAGQVFSDVPAGHWAGVAIQTCVDNDVVQGYGDGTYHPERQVTRDQMAVYMQRAWNLSM